LSGGLAVSAADASVYDFENLVVDGGLNGRDGWVRAPEGGFISVRQDETPVNGTLVAKPLVGVDSGYTAYYTRVNNDTFRFSPFFGTETQVIQQFDTTAQATSGFGVGADTDGNGLVTAALGEVGPMFGSVRTTDVGVEQFGILAANYGAAYVTPLNTATRCCNEPTDWYRMQLRMNLTANGGAGSGSLYYMNLTRGDTEFQPIAELQNKNLRLDTLNPAAGPESWNAMFIVMEFEGARAVPKLDNLMPRFPIVMQRNLDLSIQAIDGLDTFGAKFDIDLRRVADPAQPDAFIWRLARFAIPPTSTPSTSGVLPSWNLVLDEVDISAVNPYTSLFPDACLEFEGWDGSNVMTMTWQYVAGDCQ
jgi:hypothetical protein